MAYWTKPKYTVNIVQGTSAPSITMEEIKQEWPEHVVSWEKGKRVRAEDEYGKPTDGYWQEYTFEIEGIPNFTVQGYYYYADIVAREWCKFMGYALPEDADYKDYDIRYSGVTYLGKHVNGHYMFSLWLDED